LTFCWLAEIGQQALDAARHRTLPLDGASEAMSADGDAAGCTLARPVSVES
jgi:hypothetical protein